MVMQLSGAIVNIILDPIFILVWNMGVEGAAIATIIGQMFGIRGGYNGFWMMWTPNLVLGLLGIILYLRLKRK